MAEFAALAPFWPSNPPRAFIPVLWRRRRAAHPEGAPHELSVKQNGRVIRAIQWKRRRAGAPSPAKKEAVEIAYTLEENEYMGISTLSSGSTTFDEPVELDVRDKLIATAAEGADLYRALYCGRNYRVSRRLDHRRGD